MLPMLLVLLLLLLLLLLLMLLLLPLLPTLSDEPPTTTSPETWLVRSNEGGTKTSG